MNTLTEQISLVSLALTKAILANQKDKERELKYELNNLVRLAMEEKQIELNENTTR